jgi:hypothetical protein
MARAGRVLEAGDTVEYGAGVFTVEHVDNRRISRIRFASSGKTKQPPLRLVALMAGLASYSANAVMNQLPSIV